MKRLLCCILYAALALTASYGQTYVNYESFGAAGDGVTDDLPAIIAAHEWANAHSIPVKVASGKKYYIGGAAKSVVIRTDVNFGNARFIINDRDTEDYTKPVFCVQSDKQPFSVEGISSLHKGQNSLGVSLPGRCLVVVQDDSSKVYIRKGLNKNNGASKKEVLLVGPDGKVLDGTEPVWDYERLTSVVAYPADDAPLTIRGGYFTTIANQADSEYKYRTRGFVVSRSNVTVENLTHYVEGEMDHGAPYQSFLVASYCADMTVSDCMFTGHKTYWTIGAAGSPVSMGSYDISAMCAANVRFVNCTQNREINDMAYWGVFASNFCKNLEMDGCVFSRFDAHQGVKNVTIRGCTLGYMGIRLVGFGTIRIEDTEVRRDRMIWMRADYGSSWDGDIYIKNCRLKPVGGSGSSVCVISGSNSGDHDFGYLCSLPSKVVIDGLVIDDSDFEKPSYEGPFLFSSFDRDADAEGLQPLVAGGRVKIRNVRTTSGKPFRISPNKELFKDYSIPKKYR